MSVLTRIVAFGLILYCASACATSQPASTTRPAAGFEPGEAEARQRTTSATMPTTFSSPAVEVRGVWLASRDMTAPRDELIKKLDRLKAANFNTVLIDTYFRGYVAYPGGAFVPQFPDFNGQDVLGWLIDECDKSGLEAHLWMEYGFYAYFTPDATKDPSMGAILDAHPDLLSVDADGTRFIHRTFGDFYSMCPSNPKSHQILADVFAEAVRKYPKANGVNLDRIRYAAGNYCYCNYCKEHFPKDTGIELRKFAERSPQAKRFLDWKRERTAKAVETIASAVRAAKPGMKVTSYVVGPEEMDDKAQGWDLWMKRGLLDAVAVSMYGADVRDAAERAIELLGPSRDKLICAIASGQKSEVYLTNVELSRGLGAIGQYTWHWGDVFDDLDALRRGPYATPAKSPVE